MELVAAAGDQLDRVGRQEKDSGDFGELSRRALLASLSAQIGEGLPGFFEATPEEVRRSAARASYPAEFSKLARSFFTDLLSRTLRYWLDRTLSTHVGPEKRFAHAGQRAAFDQALQQYCFEATRIIAEFSAGWYGRRFNTGSAISRQDVAGFGAVAFKKINSELRRKWTGDG